MNDLGFIRYYTNTINDKEVNTKKAMREETGLLLNRERTIFQILSVATIVSVIITVNYARN
jgi:hypothetical protein